MNWGNENWVAIAVGLRIATITVLDLFIDSHDQEKMDKIMKPLVEMIQSLISQLVSPDISGGQILKFFAITKHVVVSQSKRPVDLGPLTVKFIELQGQGLSLEGITEPHVDNIRMKYDVDIYEEFIQSPSQ